MKNKIFKAIKNPRKVLIFFWILCSKLIKSDKLYLKIYYFISTNKKLDFKNPITFTQKIQWLKLNNHSDVCIKMSDKYEVREIIKEKIGEEYLIPLLGVWDDFDEIDFDILPNQFVLKTTHDSGTVVVCKDKSRLNINDTKKRINKSLKRNYFWVGREYPYKNVKPRILAEQFMTNEDNSDIVDFKFFCFNGIPKILFYASDRYNKRNELAKFDYYDMDLNHLPIKSRGHKNSDVLLKDIANFEIMKQIASKLSNGFPHLRVDLYSIRGKIYFGELTFYHDSGIVPFVPEKWDRIFGDMIKLPKGV